MNENHIRVLGVYLHCVEKNLDYIRRELQFDPAEVEPILHSVIHDVREDTKTAILHNASIMLEEIRSIKHEYGLLPQQEYSMRRVNGALTEIWTTIFDLRPKRLERYGPLTEEDERILDSLVSRLLGLLSEMYSSLGSH